MGRRAVFLGTHTPKLDEKGRLFLPAKFRDELAGGVVITKGPDRCLFVFKQAYFWAEAERLQHDLPNTRQARDYNRRLFSSAFDDVPDKTGRVTLPAPLREYAGLTKDCVVTGINTRLEIWDGAAWAALQREQDAASLEQFEGGGFGIQ